MNNNIGYSVFKQNTKFIVESNGILLDFDIRKFLDIKILEPNIPLLTFKKIDSTILVILLECVQKNGSITLLGSAIAFKKFSVNEDKIINGVHYLLHQLKNNFFQDIEESDNDLGVLLPSTNKDYNIFNSSEIEFKILTSGIVVYDITSINDFKTRELLRQFYSDSRFDNVKAIYISENKSIRTFFQEKGMKYVGEIKMQKTTILTKNKNQDSQQNKDNKIEKNELYKNLFVIFFIASLLLLLFPLNLRNQKKPYYKSSIKTNDNSNLAAINDSAFISTVAYNVNVRSSPVLEENIISVLADGDKIFLDGFDKKTLWAKIKYDDNKTGYVHNKLISKYAASKRIEPINKTARVNYTYTPIFITPKYNLDDEHIQNYLDAGDEIYVKNKILKYNTYSISYKMNGQIYHGYILENRFHY